MPQEKGFLRLEDLLAPALAGLDEDARSSFSKLLRDDYGERIGDLGEFPFTRGICATMYRGRKPTIRQFAGHGLATDTNERFKTVLKLGGTGLSTAFDLPTLMGRGSDDPISEGQVGWDGAALDTLADMEDLFDGIPIEETTVSMTINGPAAIVLTMYFAMARKRGIPLARLGGTTQNDILKEYIAQKEWLFPVDKGGGSGRGHDGVLRPTRAQVAPGVHQRLPHPRGGGHRRPGAVLYPRRRRLVRSESHRSGHGRPRLRPASLLLLRRPQRLFRRDRQAPRRPAAVGEDHARRVRCNGPQVPIVPHPRPNGGRYPDAHGAHEQHRQGSPAGPGGDAGGRPRASTPTPTTRCSPRRPRTRSRWPSARSRFSRRSRRSPSGSTRWAGPGWSKR